MPIKDGGGEVEEGISASARDEGGGSARGGIGACGGEQAIGGGKVLITPAAMVSSREFGEFAEPYRLMKVGSRERLEGWVRRGVITNRGGF
jgi:hypothetical protein